MQLPPMPQQSPTNVEEAVMSSLNTPQVSDLEATVANLEKIPDPRLVPILADYKKQLEVMHKSSLTLADLDDAQLAFKLVDIHKLVDKRVKHVAKIEAKLDAVNTQMEQILIYHQEVNDELSLAKSSLGEARDREVAIKDAISASSLPPQAPPEMISALTQWKSRINSLGPDAGIQEAMSVMEKAYASIRAFEEEKTLALDPALSTASTTFPQPQTPSPQKVVDLSSPPHMTDEVMAAMVTPGKDVGRSPSRARSLPASPHDYPQHALSALLNTPTPFASVKRDRPARHSRTPLRPNANLALVSDREPLIDSDDVKTESGSSEETESNDEVVALKAKIRARKRENGLLKAADQPNQVKFQFGPRVKSEISQAAQLFSVATPRIDDAGETSGTAGSTKVEPASRG